MQFLVASPEKKFRATVSCCLHNGKSFGRKVLTELLVLRKVGENVENIRLGLLVRDAGVLVVEQADDTMQDPRFSEFHWLGLREAHQVAEVNGAGEECGRELPVGRKLDLVLRFTPEYM
jgi:hypothetical protein